MIAPAAGTCPICGLPADAATKPFCSRRCKLLDLGKWLNEENLISEPLNAESLERLGDLPPGKHLNQPDPDEPR